MKTQVVFTARKVGLCVKVPRLNTPALFSFGGEAHLEMFPLFVDKFSTNLCCFFVDLRTINMTKSETDRVIVFLQMIFDRNWPQAWTKSQNQRQTSNSLLWCRPNSQSERRKWTLPLFENVESKSSPKRMNPKKIQKVDTFIFNLGDLALTEWFWKFIDF